MEFLESRFCRTISQAAENTANFIRVAPQWWVPGVILAGISGYISYRAIEDLSSGLADRFIVGTFVGLFTVAASGICEYAAYEYFRDYQRMKGIFLSHGWNQRVVKDRVHTYCGWRTARIAAIDSGYGDEFDDHVANHSTTD